MHTAIDSPKPKDALWTDDQWDAIVTSGSNILVAAAAGSGKTAVLVERIIRKISADTDVDRLLVATFTKAAAAEMKERIRLALEKELEKQPHSEHLRRQLALMNRASITTLHSFCLDVIRRFYPLIGLDPGFRIANETESELLRLDVLDKLFERKYEDAGDAGAFLRLADRFGGERGDEPLYRLVQQLFDFAQSHPWPDYWLRQTAAAFLLDDMDELRNSSWATAMRNDVYLTLSGARDALKQALDVTRLPGGPAPYAAALEEDLALVSGLESVVESLPWEEWSVPFQAAQFGKLKAMRGEEYDKALQERAKELRDQAKKLIAQLADEWFGRPAELFLKEIQELAPFMESLSELVIEFAELYEIAKREKGLLDFGDLEHYCLRILRDPRSTPEAMMPSSAATEYQQQFDEILLDEYQDTNMVQEAIVSLIERPGSGNRFMVGDVKQSIYRFRLAEPNLFLRKYKAYRSAAALGAGEPAQGNGNGLRIDLARNFRSRREVVDGVNGVFRAIMRESVAEMDYDPSAELVCGASYPVPIPPDSCTIELAVLNKSEEADETPDGPEESPDMLDEANADQAMVPPSELKTVQLEARWMAQRLNELMSGGYRVYDGKKRDTRPMQWRDVVILLRATRQWSPVIIEELQAAGIPAYAELGTGYFDAVEVETMLSLLRVIDNPYQDIPLAAALRSPVFSLEAEELARIRILSASAAYYDAVLYAAADERLEERSRHKLSRFLLNLERWRQEARQGSLSDLLWTIYRDTGYYDFVGGLPGGLQRQANLRALHDRARQYEATSFRGLFRFLRFIERMRDSGGDLGTARALGEQENVVRIMSIHKSKGLEFPVVFVAGLGKSFNQQDIRSAFLKHKQLGFGPRFVDPEQRISYPTLPYLAIRKAMRMEMLAEEMRILYVALTRPKEKLFLVGTVSDAAVKLSRWQAALPPGAELSDFQIASATTFLDWLGPLAAAGLSAEPEQTAPAGMEWRSGIVAASLLGAEAAVALDDGEQADPARELRMQAIKSIALLEHAPEESDLRIRLDWSYPHTQASGLAAKTSVTEMKRLHAEQPDQAAGLEDLLPKEQVQAAAKSGDAIFSYRLRRPSFLEEKGLTPAEKGSVHHLLMQHVQLAEQPTDAILKDTLERMIELKLITVKQAQAIDLQAVATFFASELGSRLLRATSASREVPFSCMLPASRVYPGVERSAADEKVLIQGVIDCMFEDERGVVLLDYKTDRVINGNGAEAAQRHRFQLGLYAEAIELITGRKVDECYVFFFDGGQTVRL